MVKKTEGGILAAKGYSVASRNIGINAGNTKRDLTLIKSDVPATVVGTFTRNIVKAIRIRAGKVEKSVAILFILLNAREN